MLRTSFSINRIEKILEVSLLSAVFVLPFSIALMEIGFVAVFASWFLLKFLKKENLFPDRFFLILIGLFIATSSVSALYSGYPAASFRGIIKIVKYSTVFLIAADFFRDKKHFDRLLLIGSMSLLIVLADSMAQLMIGRDLINNFKIYHAEFLVRLTGPYQFYGLLAAQLIAILPLLLSLIFIKASNQQILNRLFLIVLFLSGLFVLYKSHSRGAWLASFGSWLIYALFIKSKKLFSILILLLILAPFIIPRSAIIHEDIKDREQSLFERYRLWERAIQVIEKRPWFGCGINTYTKNYPRYDEVKSWRVPGYYVHNGYLQIAAETGLPSLFLFLLLIGRSLIFGLRAIRSSIGEKRLLIVGVFCGCMALLFQATVDTTLHNLQSAILIWLFLGLLVGLKNSAPYPATNA